MDHGKDGYRMHFHSFQLLVTNYEECIHFYHDVLALPFVSSTALKGSGDVVFELGQHQWLIIRPKASMAKAIGTGDLSELPETQDGFAFTFHVRKLETTIEHIRWHGGACSRIQADSTGRRRMVYLRDPDGNLIELIDFRRRGS